MKKPILFLAALLVSVSLMGCRLGTEQYSKEEMNQMEDKLWERIEELNIDNQSIQVTTHTGDTGQRQKIKLELNHISKEDKKALKDEFGKVLDIEISDFKIEAN